MKGIKGFIVVAWVLGIGLIASSQGLAQPKPEGEIVIAAGSIGREIWTPLEGGMAEHYPMGIWNEKLLYRGIGADQRLYPGLAESWQISPDRLTYTFHLRKDVNFNEGWGAFWPMMSFTACS